MVNLMACADQQGFRGWADPSHFVTEVKAVALLQLIGADQKADRFLAKCGKTAIGIGSHVANELGIFEGQQQRKQLIFPLHGDGRAGLNAASGYSFKKKPATLN
ncbi:MAG: hypothetical protein WCH37_09350 [Synechococcaceae cyanobacterium ELA182]